MRKKIGDYTIVTGENGQPIIEELFQKPKKSQRPAGAVNPDIRTNNVRTNQTTVGSSSINNNSNTLKTVEQTVTNPFSNYLSKDENYNKLKKQFEEQDKEKAKKLNKEEIEKNKKTLSKRIYEEAEKQSNEAKSTLNNTLQEGLNKEKYGNLAKNFKQGSQDGKSKELVTDFTQIDPLKEHLKAKEKVTSTKEYKEAEKKYNSKEEKQRRRGLDNAYALAKYQYNIDKLKDDDIGIWDRTLGNTISGAKDMFSNLKSNNGNMYVDEKGNRIYMPSYDDLKYEKLQDETDSGFWRFVNDVNHELGKQGARMALSAVPVVGKAAGNTAYFGDVYLDSYKNALNKQAQVNGEQNEAKAGVNAGINAGMDYVLDKFGSFIGKKTGIKQVKGKNGGDVLDTLTNSLIKKGVKPKVARTVASALTEAGQEGLESPIEKITDLYTIGQDENGNKSIGEILKDPQTYKDMGYSALVGGTTGGAMAGAMPDKTGALTSVYNDYKNDTIVALNNELSKPAEQQNKAKINTYQDLINELDNYTKAPYGKENTINDINSSIANVQSQIAKDQVQNQDIANSVNNFNLGKFENTNNKANLDNNIENNKNIENKNNMLNQIAQQKVQEVQQAVQQGEMTIQEATQEVNAITQTLNQQREQLNNVNNNINTQESITNESNTFNLDENNSLKKQQNEIIQKTNPMNDEYHVGIRNENDIKTFEEAIQDDESFNWGDFTKEDAKKALNKGEIKIYSSNDIKNGTFVSTSYQQAYEYAGRDASKVKSKIVPLENIAWINGDEGQYAKVESNKSNVKNNNSNYKYRVTDKTKSGKDVFNAFPAREEGIKPKLTSVEGKISTVDNIKVGTYYEEKTGKYVTVDLETGLKISDGKTQKSSINNADKTIKEKNSEGFDWNKTRENWFDRLKISKEDISNKDYLDIDTNIPIEEIVKEAKSIEELNRIEKIYEKEAEKIEDSEKYQNRMEEILEIIDNKKEKLKSNKKVTSNNTYNEKTHTIEINTNVLENVDKKNWIKTLKGLLKTKFSKGIDVNGVNVEVTGKSRNELLSSSYTRWLRNNDFKTYSDKMKMLDGLDKIYQNQKDIQKESPIHSRTDDIVAFKRGKVNVKLGDTLYNVDVLTGIRKNTGELVYDIVNIKEDTSIGVYPRSDVSSIDNISKNSKKVNDTQYNMQQNQNNTINENKTKEDVLKINEDGTSEMTNNKPKILDETPQREEKTGIKDVWHEAKRRIVDKGEEIKRIARKTKNYTLYHKYDRIGVARGESQHQIGKAQTDLNGVSYKNFTDSNGNKVSMSLDKIWKDANKSGISNSVLQEYLVNYLNLDRLSQGVEQFENIPAYESEETINRIEKQYPQIKRIANNVWQYNRNNLQRMVDAGLVSKEAQQRYNEETPHYVRIQRNVNKGSNGILDDHGNLKINNQIKQVKGSSQDIIPLKESMAQYVMDTTTAIRKNMFGQELANTLNIGENSDIEALDNNLTVNPDLLTSDGKGNYTFTVYQDGVAKTIPIDKGVYDALNTRQMSKLEKANMKYGLGKASQIQRALLTDKNPLFLATNFFKDIGDAPLNSKYGMTRFYGNYAKALADMSTRGKYTQLYESLGGNQNSYFNNGEFTEQSKNKVSKVAGKILSPIEKGNEFVERAPRLTEFITTIKANGYTVNENGELVPRKGKKPSKSVDQVLNEAMYNAAEVTTNFKRGGDWAKVANRNGATFLNASIQGFDKQIRNFTEIRNPKQAVRLLSKIVVLGIVPGLINDAMYDDDDEYKDLPEYVKDSYYLFKGNDGKWIRIPKGRAISIFQSASRRGKNLSEGKKDAFKGFISQSANQVAPNNPFEDNVISPWINVARNKSWNGSNIESDYMQSLPESERYDAKTDEFSKWLGKTFNISPKKVNYILDQYTGVIGDIGLPALTNYAEGDEDSLLGKLVTNPIKSKFTTDSTLNNKTVGEYYDMLDEIEKNGNSMKATPLDKAKSRYVYKFGDAASALSDLYREQREIQNDSLMLDSEKYEKNKEKQREIIATMKETMDAIKNAHMDGDLIKVGNNIYSEVVEDGETKIKKFSGKNIDKADSLGIGVNKYVEIGNYIDSLKADKNSNGKAISGSKKKKVIEYIQSLDLTAQQKQAIYNSYYNKK